jgi:hypothetical protein
MGKRFYIELGRNGYSFDQVRGVTLRNLLDDMGFFYDEEDNEHLLDAEIFAKDTTSRYGAYYYGVRNMLELEEETDYDAE